MSKFRKRHPALKHGGYSSTAVLPGENPAEFEELHQAVIAELAPRGALEENIVADIVRLVWRRQNLAIGLVEIDDTATVRACSGTWRSKNDWAP